MLTLPLISRLGLSEASFLAAFSIDLAAPSNSFSAMKVGSEGSTQSSSLSISAAVANSVTHCAIFRETEPRLDLASDVESVPGRLRLCMTNWRSSRY